MEADGNVAGPTHDAPLAAGCRAAAPLWSLPTACPPSLTPTTLRVGGQIAGVGSGSAQALWLLPSSPTCCTCIQAHAAPAVVRSGKVVEQGAHKVLMQMKGRWGGRSWWWRRWMRLRSQDRQRSSNLSASVMQCPTGGFYRGLVARQQLVAEADESGLRSQFGDSGDKSLATTQGPATSQVRGRRRGGGQHLFCCLALAGPQPPAQCALLLAPCRCSPRRRSLCCAIQVSLRFSRLGFAADRMAGTQLLPEHVRSFALRSRRSHEADLRAAQRHPDRHCRPAAGAAGGWVGGSLVLAAVDGAG